jgi:hypothetical protein
VFVIGATDPGAVLQRRVQMEAGAVSRSKAAIDQLHAENFKVVLHKVIERRKSTGSVHDSCTAAPLPSGRNPNNQWPPDRQVSCYWPAHQSLFDLGIDGWWPDQGDGFDGPSRLARNRMYYEGSLMYRYNAAIEPICRKYLNLRYQLMPYLYSAVRECTQTGMPILRAIWLHYPDDPSAVARRDQYLWGRDILVAPVVEKGEWMGIQLAWNDARRTLNMRASHPVPGCWTRSGAISR